MILIFYDFQIYICNPDFSPKLQTPNPLYPYPLLFSHSVMSDSLWPHELRRAGFHVLHHLPEFAQTHVRWVHDVIQPSHPLSPSSSALNLFQHQSLFQWVSSLHQVAKVLELQLQHQSVLPMSFQGWFPLRLTGLISLQSKGLSRVFSSSTVWKHQFYGIWPSLWSNAHIPTWLLEKP